MDIGRLIGFVMRLLHPIESCHTRNVRTRLGVQIVAGQIGLESDLGPKDGITIGMDDHGQAQHGLVAFIVRLGPGLILVDIFGVFGKVMILDFQAALARKGYRA